MFNQSILSRVTHKIQPWWIWSLGALFYAYENVLQVSNGVMANQLMFDFHITAASLGELSSLYFLAYSLVQMPIGLLLDRFGVKRPLIFAIFLCVTGAALFSQSTHLLQAEIARLLIGLGSSFAALSCLQLAAQWFPANRFAFLTGILLTIGMLGQLLGEKPLAIWLTYSHWQSIMSTLAICGTVLLLFVAAFMRNKKNSNIAPLDMASVRQKCKRIFKHPASWVIALYGMLMYTPFLIFASLWGVPFLVTATHQNQSFAAGLLSWMMIGFATGAPILGWIADHRDHRSKVLAASSIGCFCSLFLVLYGPHQSTVFIACALFFSGLFSSGFLPAFSIMKETHSPDVRATSLGFMNMLNMLGTWLCLPIVGSLLDHFWHHGMAQGIRVYQLENYQHALLICPLLVLLAICLLPKLSKLSHNT